MACLARVQDTWEVRVERRWDQLMKGHDCLSKELEAPDNKEPSE